MPLNAEVFTSFDDFLAALPSGLHDALLSGLEVDYAANSLQLRVHLSVGEPDSDDPDAYRSALVVFGGLCFLCVDPPRSDEPPFVSEPLVVDAGTGNPSTAPRPHLPPAPIQCWVFVNRWNSFIRIAAASVMLTWLSETAPE